MPTIDPLEKYKQRVALRPAARLVPQQAEALRAPRQQTEAPKPEPVIRRQEPSKMILTPAGSMLQKPPDMNRPEFQMPPASVLRASRPEAPKVDALARYREAAKLKQSDRPAHKLTQRMGM